ncbi:MAG: sodium:calcium antiporter, partial [Duncaniella sp.]|nr:sodium:calcium antiporter [Duncaniella sp.]
MSIVYLILGLVCILVGANLLTDGASAVAKRYGISDLVIGLT